MLCVLFSWNAFPLKDFISTCISLIYISRNYATELPERTLEVAIYASKHPIKHDAASNSTVNCRSWKWKVDIVIRLLNWMFLEHSWSTLGLACVNFFQISSESAKDNCFFFFTKHPASWPIEGQNTNWLGFTTDGTAVRHISAPAEIFLFCLTLYARFSWFLQL